MRNLFYLSLFSFVLCTRSMATISIYETTDNSGLNKQERIETMDKYLVELSASLKKMENKLEENSNKLKSLEDIVKIIKENQNKLVETSLGEKKVTPKTATKEISEIDKLKADILYLKNKDIEKIKMDFQELQETVKIIQDKIRTR